MAFLDDDPLRSEAQKEAVVYSDSGGIDHEETSSSIARVEEDVSEGNVLVEDLF